MKKRDIIKLVKETIAKRRKKFYGQHDYYGNNVGGRNSISGMPGVWEEELMGSGLEIRQLADSFTLDELEQLYRDKKINNTDYNGAVNYLQAWINQHPTYLPQRDLTEPKRQKIRNKYLNENKMKKINEKTFAGKGAVTSFKNPATNPDFSKMDADTQKGSIETLMKGGSITTEQPLNEVEPISTLAALAGVFAAGGIVLEPGAMEDVWDFIRQKKQPENPQVKYHKDPKTGEYINTATGEVIPETYTKESMMESYMKERGNDSLMEHMDKYRKRARLMEGAWKDISPMFDADKTDDEIVQYYVHKGVAPEHVSKLPALVAKLRNNWNSIQKIKTDLEILDQEAEGLKQSSQPVVSGMEDGMEMEEKQLASGLFN